MSGRNAPRSKNGCSTCRRRKVKCGEERPICSRCLNLRLPCEWGVPVKRGKSVVPVRQLQPAHHPPRWAGVNNGHHDLTTSVSTTTPSIDPSPTPPDADLLSPDDASSLAALWPPFPAVMTPDFPPVLPDAMPLPSSAAPAPAPAPAGWPCFPPTPLYPSLAPVEIPCANSLVLTEHDQKYFQYFPASSVVFYYMKGWQWSSFNYLYQGPAACNKIIMRMILALSASDMHRNGLVVRSPGRPSAEDHGRYHYGMAVKEFRHMLESPKRRVASEELEMIFATMFLMITYEWQFGHCVRHLQLHLQGVRSLLETHPELFRMKDVENALLSMDTEQPEDPSQRVSFIPEQLLLWILYIDASCRPMGMTESLNDFVLQSGNPALHPDRLHRCARLWGRCFWGQQYPDQEVADDMENYRALELFHQGMTLRYQTWKVFVDDSGRSGHEAESLGQTILSVRERYSDLFITAKFSRTASTRRTLNTIYMAVTTWYAQILFHRRLFAPLEGPGALHRQAVTNILEISHKQHASDPRVLRRLHWPLLMAVIETPDPVQREWIRQRLQELREFHSEYLWATDVAEEVLARQDASKGAYADLGELLRNRLVL